MNQRTDTPVTNGRGPRGRFGKGNAFGKGNPFAAQAHALRKALYEAVTPEDIQAAVTGLIEQARAGNVVACRELLDRVLGKPEPIDLLVKVEELERILSAKVEARASRSG